MIAGFGHRIALFAMSASIVAAGTLLGPAQARAQVTLQSCGKHAAHPSVVGLWKNARHSCSGVVVGRTLVLTAGHCLDEETDRLTIDVGGSAVVAECRRHPAFNAEHYVNDVAACVLPEAAGIGAVAARVATSLPLVKQQVTYHSTACSDAEHTAGDHVIERTGVVGKRANGSFEVAGCETCGGDSGGPVFDEHGLVTGLVSETRSGGIEAWSISAALPWLRKAHRQQLCERPTDDACRP